MKVSVRVVPGARVLRIEPVGPHALRVSVPVPAREGKANAALIDALADHFDVPRSKVRILKGHGARHKVVEIG